MKRDEIDPNHLERTEQGYFEQDHDVRDVGCEEDLDRCAPDDYENDPVSDEHVPGTQDDLPTTYGEQLPEPADQHIVPADAPVYQAPRRTPAGDDTGALGDEDEADLWRKQKHLIEEDEDDGLKLPLFSDEEAERVLDAIGEDAGEANPDAPDGTSATGTGSEPEHGGFPEREE
ncbi:MAG: hypothetical protein HY876_04660 [Coriobacteriales bacterium]|nr:hypothetical protein [Coriobacteriales bacterium]